MILKKHIIFGFCTYLAFLVLKKDTQKTFCTNNKTHQISGIKNGYYYELWNQNSQGNSCITINENALFSGKWDNVYNFLARRGLKYKKPKKIHEIGNLFTEYNCTYKPQKTNKGNSYLAIYGWSINPLVEFYIVEDWRNWTPAMSKKAKFKDSIFLNNSLYNIYENTKINAPSIQGIKTFKQYFSIRKDKRTKGKIDITSHLKKWKSLEMKIGNIQEISFAIEGFKNSGKFKFNKLNFNKKN